MGKPVGVDDVRTCDDSSAHGEVGGYNGYDYAG
jgi:hypothetical protein